MPAPLDDEKRAAILADITAGQKSRNAIARDHGVAASTVSRLAQEAGPADAFDRSKTENATRARRADLRAERAQLAERMLRIADRLLDQLDQPHLVFAFAGKDGVFRQRTLPKPPTGDIRNLMTSAAVAIDKHVVLDRHDTDDGAEAGRSMLADVAAAIGAGYAAIRAQEGEDAGVTPDAEVQQHG